jgi:hypothetical protein
MTTKTITVSFPLGLFGSATMNIPEAAGSAAPVMELPMDRQLLDMPNVIPETEGAEEYFYFEDIAG